MLVDSLFPIYYDKYEYSKADAMDKIIADKLPKIQKLGLTVPEYVTSGENFIDYLNNLSGNNVTYKEEVPIQSDY